jgi:hypothetical protein
MVYPSNKLLMMAIHLVAKRESEEGIKNLNQRKNEKIIQYFEQTESFGNEIILMKKSSHSII